MVCFFFMAIVATFKCLTDKYSGKVGENKCLNKCYQYFDKVNKNYKCQGYWREAKTNALAHFPKNKNQ